MNTVVTTFSPAGWDSYGKRFVDSFLACWPDEWTLHCFLEGQHIPAGYPKVAWHDLENDHEHEAFVKRWAGPEWNSPTDFNEMSVRFSHKVFAVTSDGLPRRGWRVWCDADVLFTRDVTAFLPAVFPEGKSLCYLGRKGQMRPGQPAYTECGFVGYNLDHPGVLPMLSAMRRIYTSGTLFTLGRHNWHDSYVFDLCRDNSGLSPMSLHNLSASAKGMHVWPQTVLAQFSQHQKGPRRKQEVYGS